MNTTTADFALDEPAMAGGVTATGVGSTALLGSVVSDPFVLNHWAPSKHADAIRREGLKIGKISRDGVWRAPYICFSDSAELAWQLSAAMQDEHEAWTLFMVWSDACHGLTQRDDMPGRPSEFRVSHDISPELLWCGSTRSALPNKADNPIG
jgi:hypothetical protein